MSGKFCFGQHLGHESDGRGSALLGLIEAELNLRVAIDAGEEGLAARCRFNLDLVWVIACCPGQALPQTCPAADELVAFFREQQLLRALLLLLHRQRASANSYSGSTANVSLPV